MAWRLRADKEEFIKDYGKQLGENSDLILAEYRGLTAKEMTDLRKQVRDSGFKIRVIKNTLLKRILNELKVEGLNEHLDGPVAMISGGEELNNGAKALSDFAKAHELLVIKAGLLGGNVITNAQIKDLADLPSREVLLGIVAGTLNAPISGLARSLSGIIRGLATAIDAVAKQKS